MADAKFLNKEKILARFSRMPASVQATAAHELKTQVGELADAIRRAAPVSPLESHPGELRDNIEVFETEGRVVSFRIMSTAKDQTAKGNYYGVWVEFGYTAANGTRVPAQPFFFPTYRAWKRGLFAAVRKAVRAELKSQFPEFFK